MPTLPYTRCGKGETDSFVVFEKLLSRKQCAAVRRHVASRKVQRALATSALFDENHVNGVLPSDADRKAQANAQRNSRTTWLERNLPPDDPSPALPGWLHARLRAASRAVHAELGDELCPVGVDALGRWAPRYEPAQYAEYAPGCHYNAWHTDAEVDSEDTEDLRAVTIVVLLADESAYDGGEFQVRSGGGRPGVKHSKPRTVPLRAGDAIGFPSQRLEHRVLPVTRGLRQSIVFWAKRR